MGTDTLFLSAQGKNNRVSVPILLSKIFMVIGRRAAMASYTDRKLNLRTYGINLIIVGQPSEGERVMERNPESPWNPRAPAEITSEEFEKLVLTWLREASGGQQQAIEATHLGVVEGAGGEYEIDVLVKLTVFDEARIDVLVECKHRGRPVEREAVMVLEAKLRDVGAHKGILFSTSGFQRGALQYATARGIATVTVIEGKWLYETRTAGPQPVEPPPWIHFDAYAGEHMTARDDTVSCQTIKIDRLDALRDWLVGQAPAE